MENNDVFYVSFDADNHDFENEDPCLVLSGNIAVKAKDIFEALQVSSNRIKTFGFKYVTLNGARRGESS